MIHVPQSRIISRRGALITRAHPLRGIVLRAGSSPSQPPPEAGPRYGLDFPANLAYGSAKSSATSARFALPNNCISFYPLTVIWRTYVRQHTGYYIPWIIGGVTGETWDFDRGYTTQYYTPDPYPITGQSAGTAHKWASSCFGKDMIVSGEFFSYSKGIVSGDNTVEYGRWYTQAAQIEQYGTTIKTKFWYDLPDTSKYLSQDGTGFSDPYNLSYDPLVFVVGDAPWNASKERHNGYFRGLQIYQHLFSQADILTLAANDTSNTPSVSGALAHCKFISQNLKPTDIFDYSGNNNHGIWYVPSGGGINRPNLWTEA